MIPILPPVRAAFVLLKLPGFVHHYFVTSRYNDAKGGPDDRSE